MTEPDNQPPVGATVTDARGYAWRMSDDRRWHWIIGSGLEIAGGVPPSDHDAALTALWRMQQERGRLRELAVEAKALISPQSGQLAGPSAMHHNLRGLAERLAALAPKEASDE